MINLLVCNANFAFIQRWMQCALCIKAAILFHFTLFFQYFFCIRFLRHCKYKTRNSSNASRQKRMPVASYEMWYLYRVNAKISFTSDCFVDATPMTCKLIFNEIYRSFVCADKQHYLYAIEWWIAIINMSFVKLFASEQRATSVKSGICSLAIIS